MNEVQLTTYAGITVESRGGSKILRATFPGWKWGLTSQTWSLFHASILLNLLKFGN